MSRQVIPCPSNAAYIRHVRAHERPCDGCRAAHIEYGRAADARRPRRSPAERKAFPRYLWRDEVLDSWSDWGRALGRDAFAARMGMSPLAFERMFHRARAAGDPRGQRPSWGWLSEENARRCGYGGTDPATRRHAA